MRRRRDRAGDAEEAARAAAEKAAAKKAAADGANVAIAAKTAEPHPKLPGTIYTAAKEIEAAGGKALPIIVDVRSEEQVQAIQNSLEAGVSIITGGPGTGKTRIIEGLAQVLVNGFRKIICLCGFRKISF